VPSLEHSFLARLPSRNELGRPHATQEDVPIAQMPPTGAGPDREPKSGMPPWVKVGIVALVALVVLVVILTLTGVHELGPRHTP
jgi:hypothetical protein